MDEHEKTNDFTLNLILQELDNCTKIHSFCEKNFFFYDASKFTEISEKAKAFLEKNNISKEINIKEGTKEDDIKIFKNCIKDFICEHYFNVQELEISTFFIEHNVPKQSVIQKNFYDKMEKYFHGVLFFLFFIYCIVIQDSALSWAKQIAAFIWNFVASYSAETIFVNVFSFIYVICSMSLFFSVLFHLFSTYLSDRCCKFFI